MYNFSVVSSMGEASDEALLTPLVIGDPFADINRRIAQAQRLTRLAEGPGTSRRFPELAALRVLVRSAAEETVQDVLAAERTAELLDEARLPHESRTLWNIFDGLDELGGALLELDTALEEEARELDTWPTCA